jgi:hypothetical protein
MIYTTRVATAVMCVQYALDSSFSKTLYEDRVVSPRYCLWVLFIPLNLIMVTDPDAKICCGCMVWG